MSPRVIRHGIRDKRAVALAALRNVPKCALRVASQAPSPPAGNTVPKRLPPIDVPPVSRPI